MKNLQKRKKIKWLVATILKNCGLRYFIFIRLFVTATVTAQTPLIWHEPGKDFHDAIPLGNGDIGISTWTEKDGKLKFYLSKTDAYDDNNRLLKLGLISVEILPNPFEEGQPYTQELDLQKGEMTMRTGTSQNALTLRVWVDANHPVVHVGLSAKKNFSLRVQLENWRKEEHIITDTAFSDPFSRSIDGSTSIFSAVQYPDSILENRWDEIAWFHHNQHSCWANTLKFQELEQLVKTETDPLQDRIFGGNIFGHGLIRKDDTTLVSGKPVHAQQISIIALTKYSTTPVEWLKALNTEKVRTAKEDMAGSSSAHRAWWSNFWNRSWVHIQTPGDTGNIISRGYALQRWMTACSGRGKGWIKFNGSIFTLPWQRQDPDYRNWGGAQWFQNIRLVYWPMIASGDFDVIAPFYGTYLNALPLARERTKQYYGHGGAFFSETSYTWGTYANADYGYNRQQFPAGLATNTYVRYYWSCGLELSAMMLDQYAITGRRKFLTDTLLPLATAITQFYGEHWKTGPDGKILFDPAQSLETWQRSVNPLPEVAGLKYILGRLLELPEQLISPGARTGWKETLNRLPAVPMKMEHDSAFLLPAVQYDQLSNEENPELYAIFPYRLYGTGKPDLQTGINSFTVRKYRESICWRQDEIQAACLCLVLK